MKSEIVLSPLLRENLLDSYEGSKSTKNEEIWRQLGNVSVGDALHLWLETLRRPTRGNYHAGFKRLAQLNLVNLDLTLQQFSLINHETVIDEVKLIHHWSEATRQARAAAYISFTGFLQRRTQGIIHKAVSNKEGANKTFFKVREKVKTNALSQIETRYFFQEIEKINSRDALMAKLLLQGGKRKAEVLALNTEQINFVSQTITFIQTKTRGMEKVTVINYPPHIMSELKAYIGQRSGLVFITQNGRKISPFQIDRNFLKAGKRAQIPFRVTPHVLRVTLVTRLKELKVQDSDIMKITGHANPAQLSSYDKTELSDNATLYHHFV
ncbi:MAG: site-specific integrase [Deltaproteobacteria bacterium]|jgi:integrase/recombinase XerD|nr:site-specific integrase [Deltaproteobacteria bacterium]MBT4264886.1 site-specific integrase [Deltaproteobacteria bacterium]MBT4640028.1 site-specific integrase [Deltaproteobacteria bacterium]MBT7153199.1 site-specific integrase [Deltaproteobacteria bacterium]MBT7716184.1 site-specific integrase [Deltaproteobacteria bacterium]